MRISGSAKELRTLNLFSFSTFSQLHVGFVSFLSFFIPLFILYFILFLHLFIYYHSFHFSYKDSSFYFIFSLISQISLTCIFFHLTLFYGGHQFLLVFFFLFFLFNYSCPIYSFLIYSTSHFGVSKIIGFKKRKFHLQNIQSQLSMSFHFLQGYHFK